MRRIIGTLLIGLLVSGLLTSSGMAAATSTRLPRVINGMGATLHPEGVAWDPTRRAFLIGSVPHGTVSVVGADGQARTLASDPRMTSTFGVHVDAERGRVLVVYQAGVGILDLRTGRTLRLVPVGMAPNDLAIDRNGNAFVTDLASDSVYKVDVRGRVTVAAKDPRLAGQGYALNGIVWHQAGFLLAVRTDNGKLLRISLTKPARITEVKLSAPLVGADGLAFQRDGRLVVVSNKVVAPGADVVTVLRPVGLWSSGVVTRQVPWPIAAPTTAAVTPDGTYVVNGLLDEYFLKGQASDRFHLTRIPG